MLNNISCKPDQEQNLGRTEVVYNNNYYHLTKKEGD